MSNTEVTPTSEQPGQSTRHTFLFADLAGFTALTEAHGDRDAVELAAEFCQIVRELLPEHQAEEIKTIGDAVMCRCDDPTKAIELGLRIVDEIGARPRFPIVRIGMHSGPAIERDGDWFGAAVNLAARVSAAAAGNEVLLTDASRRLAGALEGVQLSPRREQRFKNISEPVTIYQATREGQRREELPIDPVCRMAVDPHNAAGSRTYEGREYFFCSLKCASAFAARPTHYSPIDA